METYRVQKKGDYCIIQEKTARSWRKRGNSRYSSLKSANEKMQRLRLDAEMNHRGDVGKKIVASMPFCSQCM